MEQPIRTAAKYLHTWSTRKYTFISFRWLTPLGAGAFPLNWRNREVGLICARLLNASSELCASRTLELRRHEVASVPLGEVIRDSCVVSSKGDSLMSCIPLPKAVELVWANQLTPLPSLVVNVKFVLLHIYLLASTSYDVLLGQGSEKSVI